MVAFVAFPGYLWHFPCHLWHYFVPKLQQKRIFLSDKRAVSRCKEALFPNVPPHGTNYSTPWNNLFHPMEHSEMCHFSPEESKPSGMCVNDLIEDKQIKTIQP